MVILCCYFTFKSGRNFLQHSSKYRDVFRTMKTFQERSKSAVAVAREYFQSPTAVKLKDFLELFNDVATLPNNSAVMSVNGKIV